MSTFLLLRRIERSLLSLHALILLVCLLAVSSLGFASSSGTSLYGPVGTNEVANYARVIRLQHNGANNGTLLATFEHGFPNGTASYLVIRKSTDDGATWSTLSTVPEPNGWPIMWQPFLFELPKAVGSYPAGTILLAENSLPSNTNNTLTCFYLFSSTDQGATWSGGTQIDTGGGAGAGIWEPFLLIDGLGNLDLYFSDERQSSQWSQFLGGYTFNTTLNAFDTSQEIPVVQSATQSDRPGMITIAKIPGPQFMASYEICGPTYNCAVHLKVSTDGHSWGSVTDIGTGVTGRDGNTAFGNPYLVWSPLGGTNGQLSLTSGRTNSNYSSQVLVNDDPAFSSTAWQWIPRPFVESTLQYSMDPLPSWDGTQLRLTAGTHPYVLTGSATSGNLPYVDPFNTGDDSGWLNFDGSWSVSVSSGQGTYSDTGGAGAKAIAGSTGWSDYTLKSDVKLNAAGQAGVLVRVSNPSVGADRLNGYYIGINSTNQRFVIGRENGSWTSLSYATISGITSGHWYTLTVTANGSNLSATLTNQGSSTLLASLNVSDSSFLSGAIGLRDYNTSSSWENVSVAALSPTSPVTPGTRYHLVNQHSALLVAVAGASINPGAALQQYSDNGTLDHNWIFEASPSAPGFYRIKNQNSGLYVTVAGMNVTPGANVTQEIVDNSMDQNWQLIPAGSGRFHLVNQGTGDLLAVAGGSMALSAAITQWFDNGTLDHNWSLVAVP